MIKPAVINRLKLVIGAFLVFLVSYILQINLAIPIFLLSLFFYFKFSYRDSSLKSYTFLNLTLLFVIIFAASYFILKQNRPWAKFYIPFSLIPMLTAILFNTPGIALLITIAASITVASVAGGDFHLGVLFLISGILSIILLRDARRRMAIIRAGFMVGLAQGGSLFFIEHFKIQAADAYLILAFNGIASSIIAVGILPVFEYLFKTVTNISLLELADFNHPLLQRMILEAPGTYHHSLVVGNLSEAACQGVGAHALLARIGAYYHDIGKLQKPGYFSENQEINENKHDTLSPTMSKMVIMNHVKDGVELAKKYKLNSRLMDFILQHHGNSLVYYFYRRALESLEEDQEVREEGFRYPGPKPDTKETAIVLLADSVEAATRALKDPTPAKIQEIVRKVINNKFIDGQLDECNLTLKDLEKISEVFIRILSVIYHSRITYPETREDRSENNHKKSPKQNSYQSQEDKKGNS